MIRRVDTLIGRLLGQLPAAHDEVAAMPAGAGGMLATFTGSIQARAELVRAQARREGDQDDAETAEPLRPDTSATAG